MQWMQCLVRAVVSREVLCTVSLTLVCVHRASVSSELTVDYVRIHSTQLKLSTSK